MADNSTEDRPGMRFFRGMDLVRLLRDRDDKLSHDAANSIEWLRENMIDPAEYMRVSNERGALMVQLDRAIAALDRITSMLGTIK